MILTWGHNGQHSICCSTNNVVNGKYAVWLSTMTLVCRCDLHDRRTREISSSLIPRPHHHLQYGKLGRSPVQEQAKHCLFNLTFLSFANVLCDVHVSSCTSPSYIFHTTGDDKGLGSEARSVCSPFMRNS